MPNTYEYECGEHGRFEQREPMDQVHSATCPDCSTPALRIYHPVQMRHANSLYFPNGSVEDK